MIAQLMNNCANMFKKVLSKLHDISSEYISIKKIHILLSLLEGTLKSNNDLLWIDKRDFENSNTISFTIISSLLVEKSKVEVSF